MYDLYATYYDASSPSLFEKDLGDKDWVVILRMNSECSPDFEPVDCRCYR